MAVIFIFIDGVGVGNEGKENPFLIDSYESFQILSGENFLRMEKEYNLQINYIRRSMLILGLKDFLKAEQGKQLYFPEKMRPKLLESILVRFLIPE